LPFLTTLGWASPVGVTNCDRCAYGDSRDHRRKRRSSEPMPGHVRGAAGWRSHRRDLRVPGAPLDGGQFCRPFLVSIEACVHNRASSDKNENRSRYDVAKAWRRRTNTQNVRRARCGIAIRNPRLGWRRAAAHDEQRCCEPEAILPPVQDEQSRGLSPHGFLVGGA
jgi:hypothetical protein